MHQPYKDPPPYPGHLKQFTSTPGYRQSYSGSEASTDVSSENLSTRQEPQGEETDRYPGAVQAGLGLPYGADAYSILARLRGMPASTVEVKSTNTGAFYVIGSGMQNEEDEAHVKLSSMGQQGQGHMYMTQGDWSDWGSGGEIIPQSQPPTHKMPSITRPPDFMSAPTPSRSRQQLGAYVNYNVPAAPVTSEALGDLSLPPPPQYPGPAYKTGSSNLYEEGRNKQTHSADNKIHVSRSQPDLSHLIHEGYNIRDITIQGISPPLQQSQTYQDLVDQAAIADRASKMVELLSEENKNLREELDNYYRKVSKLQKFEMEIQKVHEAYDLLITSGQKRESLEKAMRKKMEHELRKLQLQNKELRSKIDGKSDELDEGVLKEDLARKDATISKLLNQNKELLLNNDRLEVELSAQSSTLQEQRKHIDILDNALMDSQTTILRLQQQDSKSQEYADRTDQLQKAVASIQLSYRNRDDLEKNIRASLQKELELVKGKLEGKSIDEETKDILYFQQKIRQKDEKILELESKIAECEQKYLEEMMFHKLAIDVASTSREARIAALEQNSVESEKIIAEAKTDRLQHLDEVHQVHRKCAQLEAQQKHLHAQLAEKDAMIKVLEKHAKSGSLSSLVTSPRHSPHPSLSLVTSPRHSPHPSLASHTSSNAGSSRQGSVLDPTVTGLSMGHNKSASSGGEITERKEIKERRASLQQEKLVKSNSSSALLKGKSSLQQEEDLSQHLWQV